MRQSFSQLNDTISEKLQSNQPFSLLRIDNTSGYVLDSLYKNDPINPAFYNQTSMIEGGIYPTNMDFVVDCVYHETRKAMINADILGFVDIANVICKSPMMDRFEQIPTFFNDEFYILDPGAILGYGWFPKLQNPWTKYLSGKKVLVVSTHKKSIEHQWSWIDYVWGTQKNKIVPFNLAGVIRAPYHPSIDSRQYVDTSTQTWIDTVSAMKKMIDSYDYDVLLSGASMLSPLLVDHAKNMGKVGIQTGGAIQLYFGLLGYRWTHVAGHSGWHQMFNEYWITPMPEDRPESPYPNGAESSFAYWA